MQEKDTGFFMEKAMEQARLAAAAGEVPVGAVLVSEGRIIARTHNQTELLKDATAHAEMLAITAACAHFQSKYLRDCSIYVTLEPCPMCAAALAWTQIRHIVWAAKDEKKGCSLFSPSLLHPSAQIETGILGDQSASLLKEFFREKRN
jgi:tRNA(adenine34) deaminase